MLDKNFAVWLTGLPGSGKSVISDSLLEEILKVGRHAKILRMDEMRHYVTPEPKYSDEERQLVYNAFSYVSSKMVECEENVIMDATGNRRKYRKLARELIPNFFMIYLKCSLEVAIRREQGREDTKGAPKDIYRKGLEGESETIPGLQSDYETPLDPDLIIDTEKLGIQESGKEILTFLRNRF